MLAPGRSAGLERAWLLDLPYPVRNALRRWRGLVGMMIGVGLALGLGMTMLAVSRASTELLTGDFRTAQTDLYVVTNGGSVVPLLPGESPGTIRNAGHLLGQVRGLQGVTAAVGLLTWPMEREREGSRRRDEPRELFNVVGVNGDPQLIPGLLALKDGRWPRRGDEVLLGQKLSREKHITLGDRVRLNGRDFTVVGIGRLRGYILGGDALAYLDYRALQQRSSIGDLLNMILVDSTQPRETQARIAELQALSVYHWTDVLRQMEDLSATALVLRGIFNGLTLAIAGLFVSNMLARSVAERRGEFATLRAIGLPGRTILWTVAAEALLVCLVASLVGFLVSLGLGALLNTYVAPVYGLEVLYAADAALFGGIFVLSLLLGLVAGLFPARRATRVDPADVLREV